MEEFSDPLEFLDQMNVCRPHSHPYFSEITFTNLLFITQYHCFLAETTGICLFSQLVITPNFYS